MRAASPSPIARALIALGLRFADPALESQFCREYRNRFLSQFRIAALLGAATFFAFGFLDTLVVEDTMPSRAVRGVVVPVLLGYFGLTFAARFRPFVEFGAAFAGVVAGVGVVLIMVVSDLPSDYGHAGLMVVMVFVLAFARLRFVYGLATSLAMLVAYQAAAIWGTDMGHRIIVYNHFFLGSTFVVAAAACYMLERLVRTDFLHVLDLQAERERSDRLLLNVLPQAIAERLRVDPAAVAYTHPEATVLFADIVGFTPRSERFTAREVVRMLDDVFSRFDELALRHGVEKIKTVGDAYMAVAGAPEPVPNHAAAAADMALDMLEAVRDVRWPDGEPVSIRIGVSSGPVVAGVIGRTKFAYDLWGDTVNTASRMEAHGTPGVVQISAETRALLSSDYDCELRGTVEVKGKGPMTTYVLVGRGQELNLAQAALPEVTTTS